VALVVVVSAMTMVLAAVQGPPSVDQHQYCRAWGGCSNAMHARADLLLVAVFVRVLSLLCWLLCWLLVILGCCKICLERLAIGISLHSSMSSSLAVIMGISVDEGVLS
jgi:hypothetical protein